MAEISRLLPPQMIPLGSVRDKVIFRWSVTVTFERLVLFEWSVGVTFERLVPFEWSVAATLKWSFVTVTFERLVEAFKRTAVDSDIRVVSDGDVRGASGVQEDSGQ